MLKLARLNPFAFDEERAREELDRLLAKQQVDLHRRECDCPLCLMRRVQVQQIIADKPAAIQAARERHAERMRKHRRVASIWLLTFVSQLIAALVALSIFRLFS